MIDNWLISLMYKVFAQMNKKKKTHPNVSVRIQSEKQKPCQVIQTGKINASGYTNVGGSKDNWVIDSKFIPQRAHNVNL